MLQAIVDFATPQFHTGGLRHTAISHRNRQSVGLYELRERDFSGIRGTTTRRARFAEETWWVRVLLRIRPLAIGATVIQRCKVRTSALGSRKPWDGVR